MSKSCARFVPIVACVAMLAVFSGCSASYVTPGRGVSLSGISNHRIAERMRREPAAEFPARLAVVRVQSAGYRSFRCESYGEGNYSVVTTRDVETDEDFARLAKLPAVTQIGPINRLLLPSHLESDEELRAAAASLRADILLLYTFDTSFRVDGHDVGPLGLVTLGFLPVNEAVVTSTVSAAFLDVRSGFVYGVAEATARDTRLASAWSTSDAADLARVQAERQAFDKLLGDVEKTWAGIVVQNAKQPHAAR